MSMFDSYLASTKVDLSCPLCLELFVYPHTPKDLDCPHVYCYPCLAMLLEEENNALTCPECRKITTVPPKTRKKKGGIGTLKTNLRLRSLAENHKKYDEMHQSAAVPVCPKHYGENLHFYCVSCNVLLCRACLVLDHDKTTHRIKSVNDAYKEKVTAKRATIEQAKKELINYEQRIKLVAQFQTKVQTSTTAADYEIDKAITGAIADIRKQGQTLKSYVKQINDPLIQKCQRQREALSRASNDLKRAVTDTSSAIEKSTSYEYLQLNDALQGQMRDVQDVMSGYETSLGDANVTSFKLIPAPAGNLGKIVQVRKLKLLHSIKGIDDVQGIAAGKGGVLVIASLHRVCNYNKQQAGDNYKYSLTLDLNECDNSIVNDVAVADNGEYLVARKHYVEVYNTSGKYEQTIRTYENKGSSSGEDYDDWDPDFMIKDADIEVLSVTTAPNGMIVVGENRTPYYCGPTSSVVTVHTSNGKLVERMETDSAPERIAAMSDTLVAISSDHEQINVVDFKEWQTHEIDIAKSRSICYDAKTDCLLVERDHRNNGEYIGDLAGWNASVIEQYCSKTWKLIACIPRTLPCMHTFGNTSIREYSFHREKTNMGMTFTDDGRLAIGHRCSHTSNVSIYEVI